MRMAFINRAKQSSRRSKATCPAYFLRARASAPKIYRRRSPRPAARRPKCSQCSGRQRNNASRIERKAMTKPYKLFIPGPVSVDDDVLDALGQPVMRHYGPEWMDVYNETTALLKQVFQTRNDVFMVPGPGTAGLEMAMGSLLATGQKVIVCNNGFFGERLATVAENNGLNVV